MNIPENIISLSEAMKWAREQRGISYRALAEETGISSSFLCEVEKGSKQASCDFIVEIAKALKVPTQQLLDRAALEDELIEWLTGKPQLRRELREQMEKEQKG